MSGASSALLPIVLAHPSAALRLELLPYGLTFHSLRLQHNGIEHDLLPGPENPAHHKDAGKRAFLHVAVGRYANRVPAGDEIPVARAGETAVLKPIPNEKPTVSLHGGPDGLDVKVFHRLALGESQLFTPAERSTLGAYTTPDTSFELLSYVSPAGESGYPGSLRVESLAAITKDNGVVLIHRARLEEEKGVCPVNLTQHWGFHLAASARVAAGQTYGDVKSHVLYLNADKTADLDPSSALATGKFNPVSSTAYDFRQPKEIGRDYPHNGYDDFYFLNQTPTASPLKPCIQPLAQTTNLVSSLLAPRPTSTSPSDALGPVLASIESKESGIKLEFQTNQSGVMFYSGKGLPGGIPARKISHGGTGALSPTQAYQPDSAAFLEFHEPLAAFLNAEYAKHAGHETLLRAGEVYTNWVRVSVHSGEGTKAAGA